MLRSTGASFRCIVCVQLETRASIRRWRSTCGCLSVSSTHSPCSRATGSHPRSRRALRAALRAASSTHSKRYTCCTRDKAYLKAIFKKSLQLCFDVYSEVLISNFHQPKESILAKSPILEIISITSYIIALTYIDYIFFNQIKIQSILKK